LDSWGSRAEYIREGTNWNEIEQNILTIKKQLPNVNLQMSTVVSAFNVSTILEFLEYLKEKDLFYINNFYPSFYNIMNPDYYSYSIFTNKEKEQIIKKLITVNYSAHINKLVNQVISTLQNTEYNNYARQQFVKQTSHYDKIRNRNFADTFPELKFLNENIL
jgi:sulfatase maturation enzyme AslB (radical SAM superfamily)